MRGNRIAATGMAVAIVATLLWPSLSNLLLIVLGVILGVVVAVPAARLVRMTQMPQMVALFNGVGGGAVALIAWVEFRSSGGFDAVPTTSPCSACSPRSSEASRSGARSSRSESCRSCSRDDH